ncbi:hypothetical protein BX600DRAFT_506644 [Xylariales sp. PMI_506]|nr:hypothetical protein BX600DRAFT_506644 [Xylariales sp. PMI_506]
MFYSKIALLLSAAFCIAAAPAPGNAARFEVAVPGDADAFYVIKPNKREETDADAFYVIKPNKREETDADAFYVIKPNKRGSLLRSMNPAAVALQN